MLFPVRNDLLALKIMQFLIVTNLVPLFTLVCLKLSQLLALGYIYGGNMFILDRHKEMRYFQVRKISFPTYNVT